MSMLICFTINSVIHVFCGAKYYNKGIVLKLKTIRCISHQREELGFGAYKYRIFYFFHSGAINSRSTND